MTDQHQFSSPKNKKTHRFNGQSDRTDDNESQKQNPPPPSGVDIIALVRSLQRTAGKADCFRTGNADCDIVDCDWRTYCLETPADRNLDNRRRKRKSD
jgi:hypothetical protein